MSAWLWVLAGFLLLMLLILFLPVRLQAKWDEGRLTAAVYFWFFRVFRFDSSTEKTKNAEEQKKAKGKKAKKKKRKLPQVKPKTLWENAPLLLKTLFSSLGAVDRWFIRKIVITRLVLYMIISADDAYDTAMRFAYVNAAVYNSLALVAQHMRIRKQDIRLVPNFLPDTGGVYAEVHLRFCLFHALFALGAVLRVLIRSGVLQKLSSPEEKSADKHENEKRNKQDNNKQKAVQSL